MAEMDRETRFTMDTSSIKFGPGATREVGADMARFGARRVMVVTDPRLAAGETVATVMESLKAEGIDAVLYDRVRVEPTDTSFLDAAAFATEGKFDGYVAVGGGSVMDTAKAANLYATYPAPLLTYVNAPIGEAKPIPGPLKPLIAIPTTAGTGSETTGVAIFDLESMHAKTGIAHRALRPVMGIIDPDNTRTMPPMVAACSALDVLSHAVESFTALPYDSRPAAPHPSLRPAYQGANPISDIWAGKAMDAMARNIVRVVQDPDDDEAHDVAGGLRRDRLRQCRRAFAPRHELPGVRPGPGLPAGGVSPGPRYRAAWYVGDPQRAVGVPLDGAGEPGAAPGSGATAGRRHA
jgi:hydroxyacid-oxoacid transhydrogenase